MSEENKKHLVVAAAGTGGHVFPALAVARELRNRGWKISWIGTQTGMESKLIAKDAIDFTGLDFNGVRGKGFFGMISGGIKILKAMSRCKSLMRELKPDVMFTTGGYVAVPVASGCRKNGVRVAVMNCDADLLMSTEMILKDAWGVACGFAGSARSRAASKGRITGNPVRAEIEAVEAPETRLAGRTGPLKLLVFGGSLGARVLNETVPKALALFDPENRPQVLHQCGAGSVEEAKKCYADAGVEAEIVPFIEDMAKAYTESDLVICRAGATTVAELCAAGAASVLVPFVAKTTKHQLGNARYMAMNNAGLCVPQESLTPEHLFGILASMKREKILQTAVNARALCRLKAAAAVADMIEDIAAMKTKPV